jgi:hypothetical protein
MSGFSFRNQAFHGYGKMGAAEFAPPRQVVVAYAAEFPGLAATVMLERGAEIAPSTSSTVATTQAGQYLNAGVQPVLARRALSVRDAGAANTRNVA